MKIGTWQLALRIVCAVALLSVGFAHKTVNLEAAAAADLPFGLAAYSLPDGSQAPLCQPGTGEGEEGGASAASGCEACRISASILLPGRSDGLVEAISYRGPACRPPSAGPVKRQAFPPNAAPRAPPGLPSIA
ncbi:hypothetical protein AAFN88_20315 [Pelagibius sp. CAU 1746]|uniref:hypothetical protein n=1 Tax=Pelagibius sp. CAU 1746 TaxID=3140370 RepID=UPI00325C3087